MIQYIIYTICICIIHSIFILLGLWVSSITNIHLVSPRFRCTVNFHCDKVAAAISLATLLTLFPLIRNTSNWTIYPAPSYMYICIIYPSMCVLWHNFECPLDLCRESFVCARLVKAPRLVRFLSQLYAICVLMTHIYTRICTYMCLACIKDFISEKIDSSFVW